MQMCAPERCKFDGRGGLAEPHRLLYKKHTLCAMFSREQRNAKRVFIALS